MAKNNTKKGGGIFPILLIAIVAFLVYRANPEYWQQGRLWEDLKNGGQKKVETEDIAVTPENVEPQQPEVDPDAMLPGSVTGAKTIPINVNKMVNKNDPTYWTLRVKFKTIYLVSPEGSAADSVSQGIQEALKKNGMREEWVYTSLTYKDSADKKQRCDASIPQAFICKQCDRKICLFNPAKSEFVVVGPTTQAAIGKAKALSGDKW